MKDIVTGSFLDFFGTHVFSYVFPRIIFWYIFFGELFWRRVAGHPIHPPPPDPPMFLQSFLSFSVPVHLFKSFIEHQDSLNSFS